MQLTQEKSHLAKPQTRKLKVVISLLLLSCIVLVLWGRTYVEGFDVRGSETDILVKDTSIFEKCEPRSRYKDSNNDYFFGAHCVFEGKAPDTFDITYAVWLDDLEETKRFYGQEIFINEPGVENKYIGVEGQSLDYDDWIEIGNANRSKAIAQLPDSAWKTLTIDTKAALKKHKGKRPEGQPVGLSVPLGMGIVYPSLFPVFKDKIIIFDLVINHKGKVEIGENYRWEDQLPSNPYS